MKKTTVTALALLITGCAHQTFTVQTNRSSSTSETTLHHFRLELAEETVDAAKILLSAEMLLKQNPANIRKWIFARFIT